jgi:hypothetical protein
MPHLAPGPFSYVRIVGLIDLMTLYNLGYRRLPWKGFGMRFLDVHEITDIV